MEFINNFLFLRYFRIWKCQCQCETGKEYTHILSHFSKKVMKLMKSSTTFLIIRQLSDKSLRLKYCYFANYPYYLENPKISVAQSF